jgi:type IV pilus assembly protein PilF
VACQANQEEDAKPIGKKYNRVDAASHNTQLGLAYLKQGDRPKAKLKLALALSQAPNSASTNGAMAYYLEQTGSTKLARQYYEKAVRLAPGKGAQLNNYGAFLCRQGEYLQADHYFNKAADDINYDNTAGSLENAGLCSLSVPNKTKASLYFTRALKQDPSRKLALYELVKLDIMEKNYPKALNNLNKYPKITLNDKTLLQLASDVASKMGKDDLASSYYRRLQRINESSDKTGVNNEYNRVS